MEYASFKKTPPKPYLPSLTYVYLPKNDRNTFPEARLAAQKSKHSAGTAIVNPAQHHRDVERRKLHVKV